MEDFTTSITKMVETIYGKMMESSDILIGVSTAIAGLGCIVYLASILLPAIERGQKIEIYPLLKPIMVAIVITNFVPITTAVSDLSSKVGTAISKILTTDDKVNYFEMFQTKVNEMLERQEKGDTATPSSGYGEVVAMDKYGNPIYEHGTKIDGKLPDSTKGIQTQTEDKGLSWFSEIGLKLVYGVLVPALAWVALFIGQLFYIGMYIASKFFLVVLTIVGPLSFALSQFKVFAGSMSQWLARFISVSLWPGLCGLVQAMNHQLMKAIATNLQPTFTGVLISIILLIFSATLYLHIPTLADFVIQSGGVGGANNQINKAGTKVLNKVMGK